MLEISHTRSPVRGSSPSGLLRRSGGNPVFGSVPTRSGGRAGMMEARWDEDGENANASHRQPHQPEGHWFAAPGTAPVRDEDPSSVQIPRTAAMTSAIPVTTPVRREVPIYGLHSSTLTTPPPLASVQHRPADASWARVVSSEVDAELVAARAEIAELRSENALLIQHFSRVQTDLADAVREIRRQSTEIERLRSELNSEAKQHVATQDEFLVLIRRAQAELKAVRGEVVDPSRGHRR